MRLAIGGRYREILEDSLNKCNVSVIWLPDNPDVDKRLAGHADLSVFSGDNIVITSNSARSTIVRGLTNGVITATCSRPQSPIYPADAALCACSTGKYIIYNPKTVDPLIPAHTKLISVPVDQGYTNCSVCVVSNDAIITADEMISFRAEQAGMDVLKLQPGYIKLDGFDYGFIGGASFLLDAKRMAFTGILSGHPDEERILTFLNSHGLEPVYLTKYALFDIGGAIPIP